MTTNEKPMTLRQYNLFVEKSNAAFKKMSLPRKRVRIARDVLEALDARLLKATNGIYFENDDIDDKVDARNDKKELRDLFKGMKSCDVCALGAAFVCVVKRIDQIKVGDLAARPKDPDDTYRTVNNPKKMRSYLDRYFSAQQLRDIENAFEGFYERGSSDAVSRFNSGIHTSDERLRRVMQNIIDNKGTFKAK